MSRARECWRAAVTAVTRTKTLDLNTIRDTELKRCLNVVDLVALGVGSTLGAGLYVLTGQVARTQTGPAVVISFLIAALASFLAGLCYAEFAARVPKTGSAYVYSYVSVGELWAFIIGWNMILENMIGAASTGKAWSQYFDSLINDTIRTTIESHVGVISVPGLDKYPDFLALGLLLVVTLLVSVGVRASSTINLIFTAVNLAVIVCIIGIGVFYADVNNWTHSHNGFFPFGFRGVIAGAATCFYSFIGFDTIATSGEESTIPTKHIPVAIVCTLIICLVAYLGVSAILTLLVPWNHLADTAALPKAFAQVGVPGAEYVVAVGGMCGLIAAIMGSIFPLPRSVYAMAQDGLLFRRLGSVSRWTDTPFIATWLCGVLVALSALLFDLAALVQMMSIGTLMAYTLVAVSVLVLHYQREQVGLSATDYPVKDDVTTQNGDVTGSRPVMSKQRAASTSSAGELTPGHVVSTAARLSMSEDTGLLRVGDASKRVRYVPAKTTTVVRRIKPPTDSDEEQPPDSSSPPPPTTSPRQRPVVTSASAGVTSSSVVDEYRAKVAAERQQQQQQQQQPHLTVESDTTYRRVDSDYSIDNLSQLFNVGDELSLRPTARTKRVVMTCLLCLVVFWSILCVLTVYGETHVASARWWAVTLMVICVVAMVTICVVLARQPRNDTPLHFRTPAVPWLPLASILINIYLMTTLSPATWIRFAVWMTIGFTIYFGYGVWNSTERRSDDTQVILYDVADKHSLIVDGVYR